MNRRGRQKDEGRKMKTTLMENEADTFLAHVAAQHRSRRLSAAAGKRASSEISFPYFPASIFLP